MLDERAPHVRLVRSDHDREDSHPVDHQGECAHESQPAQPAPPWLARQLAVNRSQSESDDQLMQAAAACRDLDRPAGKANEVTLHVGGNARRPDQHPSDFGAQCLNDAVHVAPERHREVQKSDRKRDCPRHAPAEGRKERRIENQRQEQELQLLNRRSPEPDPGHAHQGERNQRQRLRANRRHGESLTVANDEPERYQENQIAVGVGLAGPIRPEPVERPGRSASTEGPRLPRSREREPMAARVRAWAGAPESQVSEVVRSDRGKLP